MINLEKTKLRLIEMAFGQHGEISLCKPKLDDNFVKFQGRMMFHFNVRLPGQESRTTRATSETIFKREKIA